MAQGRFGFAFDATGRLRVIRTYEGSELRVMQVPDDWTIEFRDDPPEAMQMAALDAAFPGLPNEMTMDEAERRLRAALIAALEVTTEVPRS